jgi:hypothetical protein
MFGYFWLVKADKFHSDPPTGADSCHPISLYFGLVFKTCSKQFFSEFYPSSAKDIGSVAVSEEIAKRARIFA